MFYRSSKIPPYQRTVGVVHREDGAMQPGYNLLCAAREVYLLDSDGRVIHEWTGDRRNFCAYLRPNGNLLRDGSENIVASSFKAGGAAGYVEEVTWDGDLVWRFALEPMHRYLSHHNLCPLPHNNNVIISVWERKSKEEAIAAGRNPEFIPDNEVWDNVLLELKPNCHAGADIVWRWSMWDHLVQDFDPNKSNYGCVAERPELYDINFCVVGGKAAARDLTKLNSAPQIAVPVPSGGGGNLSHPTGSHSGAPKTGEKDWLHCNNVSYDPVRDQIVLSVNVGSEILIIDHSTTTEEASGHIGGKYGRGGDILYRWGNPWAYRRGTRFDQQLFCQHSVEFIRGHMGTHVPGEGNIILFNNGRFPDRHWSTVDEITLPETQKDSGVYCFLPAVAAPTTCSGSSASASAIVEHTDTDCSCETGTGVRAGTNRETVYTGRDTDTGMPYGPKTVSWRFGAPNGHKNSFYCTHISGVQRLPNGNTLITQGPQGTVVEVTSAGDEVWRYISPAVSFEGSTISVGGSRGVCFLRQGDHDLLTGSRSLFRVDRYPLDYPAFKEKVLNLNGRYLEA